LIIIKKEIEMKNVSEIICSTDDDWSNQDDKTIVLWPGTLLPKEQEKDFIEFIEKLGATDVEVIGSFNYEDVAYLTFVCNPTGAFSILRFQYGMRWWYDVFTDCNGDFKLNKLGDDFKEVIDKLGLKI
jgi:hypothetical protein